MKARMAAATPGPWEPTRAGLLGWRVVHVEGEWEGIVPDEFITLVTPALRNQLDAEFIAAAPTDLAKLHAALDSVESVCTDWEALADGDKYYANRIRAAIKAAIDG